MFRNVDLDHLVVNYSKTDRDDVPHFLLSISYGGAETEKCVSPSARQIIAPKVICWYLTNFCKYDSERFVPVEINIIYKMMFGTNELKFCFFNSMASTGSAMLVVSGIMGTYFVTGNFCFSNELFKQDAMKNLSQFGEIDRLYLDATLYDLKADLKTIDNICYTMASIIFDTPKSQKVVIMSKPGLEFVLVRVMLIMEEKGQLDICHVDNNTYQLIERMGYSRLFTNCAKKGAEAKVFVDSNLTEIRRSFGVFHDFVMIKLVPRRIWASDVKSYLKGKHAHVFMILPHSTKEQCDRLIWELKPKACFHIVSKPPAEEFLFPQQSNGKISPCHLQMDPSNPNSTSHNPKVQMNHVSNPINNQSNTTSVNVHKIVTKRRSSSNHIKSLTTKSKLQKISTSLINMNSLPSTSKLSSSVNHISPSNLKKISNSINNMNSLPSTCELESSVIPISPPKLKTPNSLNNINSLPSKCKSQSSVNHISALPTTSKLENNDNLPNDSIIVSSHNLVSLSKNSIKPKKVRKDKLKNQLSNASEVSSSLMGTPESFKKCSVNNIGNQVSTESGVGTSIKSEPGLQGTQKDPLSLETEPEECSPINFCSTLGSTDNSVSSDDNSVISRIECKPISKTGSGVKQILKKSPIKDKCSVIFSNPVQIQSKDLDGESNICKNKKTNSDKIKVIDKKFLTVSRLIKIKSPNHNINSNPKAKDILKNNETNGYSQTLPVPFEIKSTLQNINSKGSSKEKKLKILCSNKTSLVSSPTQKTTVENANSKDTSRSLLKKKKNYDSSSHLVSSCNQIQPKNMNLPASVQHNENATSNKSIPSNASLVSSPTQKTTVENANSKDTSKSLLKKKKNYDSSSRLVSTCNQIQPKNMNSSASVRHNENATSNKSIPSNASHSQTDNTDANNEPDLKKSHSGNEITPKLCDINAEIATVCNDVGVAPSTSEKCPATVCCSSIATTNQITNINTSDTHNSLNLQPNKNIPENSIQIDKQISTSFTIDESTPMILDHVQIETEFQNNIDKSQQPLLISLAGDKYSPLVAKLPIIPTAKNGDIDEASKPALKKRKVISTHTNSDHFKIEGEKFDTNASAQSNENFTGDKFIHTNHTNCINIKRNLKRSLPGDKIAPKVCEVVQVKPFDNNSVLKQNISEKSQPIKNCTTLVATDKCNLKNIQIIPNISQLERTNQNGTNDEKSSAIISKNLQIELPNPNSSADKTALEQKQISDPGSQIFSVCVGNECNNLRTLSLSKISQISSKINFSRDIPIVAIKTDNRAADAKSLHVVKKNCNTAPIILGEDIIIKPANITINAKPTLKKNFPIDTSTPIVLYHVQIKPEFKSNSNGCKQPLLIGLAPIKPTIHNEDMKQLPKPLPNNTHSTDNKMAKKVTSKKSIPIVTLNIQMENKTIDNSPASVRHNENATSNKSIPSNNASHSQTDNIDANNEPDLKKSHSGNDITPKLCNINAEIATVCNDVGLAPSTSEKCPGTVCCSSIATTNQITNMEHLPKPLPNNTHSTDNKKAKKVTSKKSIPIVTLNVQMENKTIDNSPASVRHNENATSNKSIPSNNASHSQTDNIDANNEPDLKKSHSDNDITPKLCDINAEIVTVCNDVGLAPSTSEKCPGTVCCSSIATTNQITNMEHLPKPLPNNTHSTDNKKAKKVTCKKSIPIDTLNIQMENKTIDNSPASVRHNENATSNKSIPSNASHSQTDNIDANNEPDLKKSHSGNDITPKLCDINAEIATVCNDVGLAPSTSEKYPATVCCSSIATTNQITNMEHLPKPLPNNTHSTDNKKAKKVTCKKSIPIDTLNIQMENKTIDNSPASVRHNENATSNKSIPSNASHSQTDNIDANNEPDLKKSHSGNDITPKLCDINAEIATVCNDVGLAPSTSEKYPGTVCCSSIATTNQITNMEHLPKPLPNNTHSTDNKKAKKVTCKKSIPIDTLNIQMENKTIDNSPASVRHNENATSNKSIPSNASHSQTDNIDANNEPDLKKSHSGNDITPKLCDINAEIATVCNDVGLAPSTSEKCQATVCCSSIATTNQITNMKHLPKPLPNNTPSTDNKKAKKVTSRKCIPIDTLNIQMENKTIDNSPASVRHNGNATSNKSISSNASHSQTDNIDANNEPDLKKSHSGNDITPKLCDINAEIATVCNDVGLAPSTSEKCPATGCCSSIATTNQITNINTSDIHNSLNLQSNKNIPENSIQIELSHPSNNSDTSVNKQISTSFTIDESTPMILDHVQIETEFQNNIDKSQQPLLISLASDKYSPLVAKLPIIPTVKNGDIDEASKPALKKRKVISSYTNSDHCNNEGEKFDANASSQSNENFTGDKFIHTNHTTCINIKRNLSKSIPVDKISPKIFEVVQVKPFDNNSALKQDISQISQPIKDCTTVVATDKCNLKNIQIIPNISQLERTNQNGTNDEKSSPILQNGTNDEKSSPIISKDLQIELPNPNSSADKIALEQKKISDPGSQIFSVCVGNECNNLHTLSLSKISQISSKINFTGDIPIVAIKTDNRAADAKSLHVVKKNCNTAPTILGEDTIIKPANITIDAKPTFKKNFPLDTSTPTVLYHIQTKPEFESNSNGCKQPLLIGLAPIKPTIHNEDMKQLPKPLPNNIHSTDNKKAKKVTSKKSIPIVTLNSQMGNKTINGIKNQDIEKSCHSDEITSEFIKKPVSTVNNIVLKPIASEKIRASVNCLSNPSENIIPDKRAAVDLLNAHKYHTIQSTSIDSNEKENPKNTHASPQRKNDYTGDKCIQVDALDTLNVNEILSSDEINQITPIKQNSIEDNNAIILKEIHPIDESTNNQHKSDSGSEDDVIYVKTIITPKPYIFCPENPGSKFKTERLSMAAIKMLSFSPNNNFKILYAYKLANTCIMERMIEEARVDMSLNNPVADIDLFKNLKRRRKKLNYPKHIKSKQVTDSGNRILNIGTKHALIIETSELSGSEDEFYGFTSEEIQETSQNYNFVPPTINKPFIPHLINNLPLKKPYKYLLSSLSPINRSVFLKKILGVPGFNVFDPTLSIKKGDNAFNNKTKNNKSKCLTLRKLCDKKILPLRKTNITSHPNKTKPIVNNTYNIRKNKTSFGRFGTRNITEHHKYKDYIIDYKIKSPGRAKLNTKSKNKNNSKDTQKNHCSPYHSKKTKIAMKKELIKNSELYVKEPAKDSKHSKEVSEEYVISCDQREKMEKDKKTKCSFPELKLDIKEEITSGDETNKTEKIDFYVKHSNEVPVKDLIDLAILRNKRKLDDSDDDSCINSNKNSLHINLPKNLHSVLSEEDAVSRICSSPKVVLKKIYSLPIMKYEFEESNKIYT